MNPQPFEIREFESEQERIKGLALAEGFTVPLTKSEANKLSKMTTREGKVWISTRDRNRARKAMAKAARVPGASSVRFL